MYGSWIALQPCTPCAGDANALAQLISVVTVADYLNGAPEGSQIAPLFGQAISEASVPGAVQSQAYADSLASHSQDATFLLLCAEPQVDQGAFTYEQIFSQVLQLLKL